MTTGSCRLCLRFGPLCGSHALPSSLFNYILRKNAGKAIVLTDDASTPVRYSSDTWDAAMLCSACEAHLNRNFDAYGIAVFRAHEGAVHRDKAGVTLLRIDCRRLRMFFLSMLWRISVSAHDSYSNIDLPFEWEEDLRLALLSGRSIPLSRYTVSLFRLRDSTSMGGFNEEALRTFIAAPFARGYAGRKLFSVCYPFFGFFVETFIPRLPTPDDRKPGVLRTGSVHTAPYIKILEIPEIMGILVRGLQKHERGLTRVAP